MGDAYISDTISKEKEITPEKHTFVLTIVTGILILVALVIIFGLKLRGTALIISLIILIAFYISAISFLLEAKKVKQVFNTHTITQEKEVIKEIEKPIYIEKEVEKPVYIDRPVDREVIREVPKHIYVQSPRTHLNIPKYEFLGSTETKTYHQRNCRLSKLIKKKYKLSNNFESFFQKKKFSPCKMCIKKVRKG